MLGASSPQHGESSKTLLWNQLHSQPDGSFRYEIGNVMGGT